MRLIINGPTNMQTGKPTGQSWKTGMQSQTNTSRELKTMTTQQNTVKPMPALGFDELKINRIQPITKDGQVRPMAALGFTHNEIGQQATWNRIQVQLQQNDQDVHDFHMLREVYDDYIVYEVGNKLWKRGYTLDDNDQPTLDSDVQEVVEQVSFDEIKPVTSQAHNANNVAPMAALGFAHNK